MAAYEVLLLNTAVPQIQAAQSGDTYVVPRDIAFSAALTLSAGTANGVPYLNGSKVLTTGSALTYNGTGLGVGISSAGYLVDISTPLTGTTVGSNVALNLESQASGRDVEIRMGDTVNSSGRFGYLSGSLYWAFGSTEQMRLTSTGLGIGTSSPDSKLVVQGGSGTYAQIKDGTVNIFIQARSVDSAGVIGTLTNHALQFWTNSAVKATIDSSGNLGLGVTPSAWGGSAKVLELPNGTFLLNYSNSSQAIVGANAYYTGSNWLYKNTAAASNYEQNAGLHAWFTAPSGTAGNAITFTQAMTLDANGNLGIGTSSPDSGFQLTAYADVAGAIRVRGGGAGSNSARTASLSLLSSGNEEWIVRGANDSLRFLQSSTERARIASGGDLLVGTTSGAITVNGLKFLSDGSFYAVQNSGVTSSIYNKSNYTSGTDFFADFRLANTTVGSISANGSTTSYTTSSDRRLKENIAPAADAGAVVDAIEVVQHDWKVGGHTRYGMIAQDLHAVAPEAVTAGDDGDEIEKTWGVDYSKLVPMLIKEIQSLRARVAALESN